MAESPFWLLEEAAAWCRVPVKTVRWWISTGKLPSFRPGRRVLVRRDDVVALVEGAKQ